ncbi:MAG TPA: TonB-dependent receptor, partial [Sphingomicrobium sp.]|nr:TonB-dependent receptor [Sphingomicrobium sp.]
ALRAHANVGVALASNVTTRFYASANHINQELPGSLAYPLVIEAPKTGSLSGHQQRDVDSLRIQNRTNVDLNDLSLEFGAFLNAKDLFHPIFQVVDQKSLDRGAFARAGWQSGQLELLAGATVRFGSVDSKRFVNLDGDRGDQTFAADQDARTADFYTEARLHVGAARLIAGAIYTNGMRRQEQRFPVAVGGNANFNQLSPRLGVLWQPSRNLDVYANVSRSHELPGFIELAQVAAFVPLKAQHAWTAELGTRGQRGSVDFDVSIYRAHVRNELLQFTVGPDVPATTFNAGRTLHQGVEAGVGLAVTPWARLRQVYQFNDFRFRDDDQYGDNRLPVVPKHLYRAELRLGRDAWHVSPSIEWVPSGAWADYANSFKADGYATFGASGAVAVTPAVELFGDVRNIGNRKAVGDISAVINYQTLQPFQRAIFNPIEGRAFFAGVRTRW